MATTPTDDFDEHDLDAPERDDEDVFAEMRELAHEEREKRRGVWPAPRSQA